MFYKSKNSGGDVCDRDLIAVSLAIEEMLWKRRQMNLSLDLYLLSTIFQCLPNWCYRNFGVCRLNISAILKWSEINYLRVGYFSDLWSLSHAALSV